MYPIKLSYWVVALVAMIVSANPLLAKDAKSEESRELKIVVVDEEHLHIKPVDPSQLKTSVYKLQHANCKEVASHVRSLFQKGKMINKATWFKPANAILMRGTPEEIEQMVALIKEIDLPHRKVEEQVEQPQDYRIEVVPLAHAHAGELAELVERVLYVRQDRRRRRSHDSGSLHVYVDKRLNTLVLRGEETQISKAKELIERLDVPTGPLPEKVIGGKKQ